MKTFSTRIYIFALVLRLVPALLSYNLPIGLDDMFQYDMLGRSIAAGEGYRWYSEPDLHLVQQYIDFNVEEAEYDPRGVLTSFRPPAYPAFLALIYKIGGIENRFYAARIVQAFVGALLAPLTFSLAKRVFPDEERIARFGATAMAGYPMLVVFPLALATENLFMPLLLGAVLMLLKAGDTHRTRDYIFAGLLLGLASLTRSVVSAIIPAAMFWAWFYAKDKKAALIIPAFALMVTVPWAIRNTLLHEKLTYIESTLGYALYMGYHPEAQGTFQYGVSVDLLPYLDDSERDEIGIRSAIEFIRDDPGRVPELMLRKLGYLFGLEKRAFSYFYTNNVFGNIPFPLLHLLAAIFWSPFVLLTILAAAGFAFSGWRKETALVGLVMAAYIAPLVMILSDPRMHLAVVPYLAVMAGFGWVKRKEIWMNAQKPAYRKATILAAALMALLVLNWGIELARDGDRLTTMFGPEGNLARFDY